MRISLLVWQDIIILFIKYGQESWYLLFDEMIVKTH